jgi:hypothetical protein
MKLNNLIGTFKCKDKIEMYASEYITTQLAYGRIKYVSPKVKIKETTDNDIEINETESIPQTDIETSSVSTLAIGGITIPLSEPITKERKQSLVQAISKSCDDADFTKNMELIGQIPIVDNETEPNINDIF